MKEEDKGENSPWYSELQNANEIMLNFIRTLGSSGRSDAHVK